MAFAHLHHFLEIEEQKFTVDFCYEMSDQSGSGDQSKEDKKREYNRLAQREFRKRRKEHIKRLEDAQKGQSSEQNDIIERLQQQNAELYQENQTLKGLSQGSVPTSRSPHVPVSSPLSQGSYTTYETSGSAFLSSSLSSSMIPTTSVTSEAGLILLAPHSFADLCSYVYSTSPFFSLVLEQLVHANPQSDLVTLATISQSLPPSLRPTEVQLTTPHHAYIDILPSPSLRDMLIQSGPQMSTAFIILISTGAEEADERGALTIWGQDLLSETAWEFSATVLGQWGWLLGREWGRRANFWRHQRTAPLLPAWEA